MLGLDGFRDFLGAVSSWVPLGMTIKDFVKARLKRAKRYCLGKGCAKKLEQTGHRSFFLTNDLSSKKNALGLIIIKL